MVDGIAKSGISKLPEQSNEIDFSVDAPWPPQGYSAYKGANIDKNIAARLAVRNSDGAIIYKPTGKETKAEMKALLKLLKLPESQLSKIMAGLKPGITVSFGTPQFQYSWDNGLPPQIMPLNSAVYSTTAPVALTPAQMQARKEALQKLQDERIRKEDAEFKNSPLGKKLIYLGVVQERAKEKFGGCSR